MKCSTFQCNRRPRGELRICDACLERVLYGAPEPRVPEWIKRARAKALPVKDYTAA
jgi:hypothetical protein